MAFETVHTIATYHDTPRHGIADFRGRPHVYESDWADVEDGLEQTYQLTPITDEDFRLALEHWGIWTRWQNAYYEGRTTIGTHPSLPEEHERDEELRTILKGRIGTSKTSAVRVHGSFRRRPGYENWTKPVRPPLEVEWFVFDSSSTSNV